MLLYWILPLFFLCCYDMEFKYVWCLNNIRDDWDKDDDDMIMLLIKFKEEKLKNWIALICMIIYLLTQNNWKRYIRT